MSILIGLTGSIGSGKSLAASYFKEFGAYIIDADSISREVVEPNNVAWKEVSLEFGAEFFNPDQTLNREKIANEIFKNPKKRIILENIIHPRVFVIEQQLYKSHQLSDPNAIVIIDAALLIESNNYKNMDRVIVVNCSTSIQIQRVIGRNGKSAESVKSRLKTQMALEEKLKYADYTINNEGTREELKSQVLSLYRLLENLV